MQKFAKNKREEERTESPRPPGAGKKYLDASRHIIMLP